jgi:Na+/H+ antiporter NhaD/arsenite permease-like protein
LHYSENGLLDFSGSDPLVLVFMIALVSIFISEVMSNIAQVLVFSPVIAGIADALHMNPIMLGLPMCLGASCASMMPMGTPPNAIVFASGHIQMEANDANRICDEYYMRDIDYAVLLVVGACIIAGVTNWLLGTGC